MAGGGSGGRGAYWIGAFVGLVFSGSLAAVLSLVTPLGGAQPGGAATQSAATAPTPSSDPAPSTAPQPAQPTPVQDDAAAAPEPAAPASEPDAAAAEAEVALAAPQPAAPEATDPVSEEASTPTPEAAAPQPADQPATEPVAEAEPAAPAPAAPEPVEVSAADEAPAAEGLSPFKAQAEIFSGDRSQPLLAIVLADVSGADKTRLDEILLLPGPLAVIVSAGDENAASTIADVRDAGFEALIGVSRGDLGGDVAGDLAARLSEAPSIIGAALTGTEMQDSESAESAATALAEGGFAMLDMTSDGGGAPFRFAKAKGGPAAANGRRFDEIDSSALVFQALERAAFDARRTGAFVVVGAATPAVLTGLRRWMNVKANRSVTVAPLSAVIEKTSRQ